MNDQTLNMKESREVWKWEKDPQAKKYVGRTNIPAIKGHFLLI
jgi:hypothetical protein